MVVDFWPLLLAWMTQNGLTKHRLMRTDADRRLNSAVSGWSVSSSQGPTSKRAFADVLPVTWPNRRICYDVTQLFPVFALIYDTRQRWWRWQKYRRCDDGWDDIRRSYVVNYLLSSLLVLPPGCSSPFSSPSSSSCLVAHMSRWASYSVDFCLWYPPVIFLYLQPIRYVLPSGVINE